MNKFVIAAVVAVMSTAAIAADTTTTYEYDSEGRIISQTVSNQDPAQSNVGSSTGDNLLGTNVGTDNSVNSTNNTTTYEKDSVRHETNTTVESYKPNGFVNNPNLTTSGHDTCLGSSSGGISGPGFGISGGSTTIDENCVMIKQAKILSSLGLTDAAVLLLMNSDEDIAEAIWGAHPELAEALTSVSQ